MTIAEPLAECIKTALSCLERADAFDATSLVSIAEERVRSARSFVVPTVLTEEAFRDAIARLLAFHETVIDQNILSPRSSPGVEQARELAIISLRGLADVLVDARPSELARASGADWF